MNKGWLRYGLASMTLLGVGLAGFVVACGDDDSGKTVGSPDSGTQETSTPPPEEEKDAGDSGTTTPTQPNAKLQLVNAATDFGPSNPVGAIRVCYGLGPSAIAPIPPLPDRKASPAQPFPGVYVGTGGPVPTTGADLSQVPSIVPYVMNAQSLAQRGLVKPDTGVGVACDAILGGTADAGEPLVEGKDYWKLPPIPGTTFAKGSSLILVLTGCAGDSTKGVEKCGPDFTAGAPGNGNLKVTIHEVDRKATIDGAKFGAQFIHASPAGATFLQALPGGGLKVVPGFITGSDLNTFKGVSGGGGDAGTAVELNAKTDLVQIDGVQVGSDSFTANPNVAALGIPLPQIQLLTYGGNIPDGGAYRNGAAFTFVAVGDPAEDADAGGGNFNTKKFHYIALPNDPVNEVYKP